MYNQPFHTFSHIGRKSPLLVYASTMNPHPANITDVQPLAVDTGMTPRTAEQDQQYATHLCHRQQTNVTSILNDRQVHVPPRTVILHTPSPSLSVSSNHTD